MVRPVNNHDTNLLPESIDGLMDFASLIGMDLTDSYLTLDSGFWSKYNLTYIRKMKLFPVIKPNRGATKDEKKIKKLYRHFNERVYEQRLKIERIFAWQDTYRKLVFSYERLEATRNGLKYLGYALINLRVFVKNPV